MSSAPAPGSRPRVAGAGSSTTSSATSDSSVRNSRGTPGRFRASSCAAPRDVPPRFTLHAGELTLDGHDYCELRSDFVDCRPGRERL